MRRSMRSLRSSHDRREQFARSQAALHLRGRLARGAHFHDTRRGRKAVLDRVDRHPDETHLRPFRGGPDLCFRSDLHGADHSLVAGLDRGCDRFRGTRMHDGRAQRRQRLGFADERGNDRAGAPRRPDGLYATMSQARPTRLPWPRRAGPRRRAC